VNADVVRRVLQLWNDRAPASRETFAEFAQPDMVLDLSSNVLNPGTHTGYEGFVAFRESVGEAWAEFRMEPEELIEQDDLVVVLVRARARGRGSGVELDRPAAMVCEMRDGLIARMKIEPDRDAALARLER
jgi:uncharacterized protein